MYWYLLNLTSIRVPGLNITQNGFSQCNKKCGKCYTDSGSSWISLPLPESQCNDILSGKSDVLKKESMLLDIEGVNGTTITLSLPLLWLSEQFLFGNVVCTGTSGDFVLGFPIFQYYYLAYDMGSRRTVTFVDLPLSNETEAFIMGPDLGGIAESSSSGYHHYVPTISIMSIGVLLIAFQYIF